jgi:hypothetical protein
VVESPRRPGREERRNTVKKTLILLLIVLPAVIAGCAITVGKQTVGIQSGRFFFTDGTLRTNYHAPFEAVWTACGQALRSMGAKEITEEKKISKGTISGAIVDDKVDIFIDYAEYNVITVGVRVGISGNNAMSQQIHDRIKENLLKK